MYKFELLSFKSSCHGDKILSIILIEKEGGLGSSSMVAVVDHSVVVVNVVAVVWSVVISSNVVGCSVVLVVSSVVTSKVVVSSVVVPCDVVISPSVVVDCDKAEVD